MDVISETIKANPYQGGFQDCQGLDTSSCSNNRVREKRKGMGDMVFQSDQGASAFQGYNS
mgnify:CR=1 FL=1